jgi:hypothetical protein
VTASPGEFSAWRAQVREDDPDRKQIARRLASLLPPARLIGEIRREDDPDRKQIARRLASLPPPARLWGTTPDARASKPGRTGQRGSRAAR